MIREPTPDELALAAVTRAPWNKSEARCELLETARMLSSEGFDREADNYRAAQALLDDYYRS